MRRSRRARDAGFTLIETTLALALIGLIAALALPRVMPGSGATALRIKAFEVAALLRSDRNAALRTGRTIATDVDFAARRVRSGASGAIVALPQPLTLRLAGDASAGFRFFPDGSATGGALTIARSGTALSVRVNGLTAAVDIRQGEPDGG